MPERREYIGKLIVAGPARTMTGEAGRYVVTAEAIRRAVEDGLFRGLACFADHAGGGPGCEGPTVRRLLGVWHDVEWRATSGQPTSGRATSGQGGAAVGRLATYDTAATRPVLDLLDQWLGDAAGAGAPDLGISLVFYPVTEGDGRTVRRIVMIESADLVMFPASVGSRIVQRVASGG
jgi:hypothetical protein